MDTTVQEDEERPPPPPPEEQQSEPRDPRISNRNPTLELAESIVDSVLGPCASEASRLSNYIYFFLFIIIPIYFIFLKIPFKLNNIFTGQSERTVEGSNTTDTFSRSNTSIVVDFSQEPNEDLQRESDASEWIRIFTDDSLSNVERK